MRRHGVETRGAGWRIAATIPGLLLTCLVFAFVIRPQKLLALEQFMRMPAEVQLVEAGVSVNGIELDPTGTFLYVTGQDLPRVRRYDARNLSAPPILSNVSTDGAQGLAYDPRANEVYVFNTVTRQLLYLDATTLQRKRFVSVPDLSPGDPWVTVDPITDTLTLASEADLEVGIPFIVLDRPTGRVIGQAALAAGNVLLHPTKPWLYLTFFRRRNEVMLYDLQNRSVTHSTSGDKRAERMVFSRRRNELLVTSPMESRIMRFDADRLHLRGYIPTSFGVRGIAIDEARDLLLYGNIASGHLVVIDPKTGARLRSYYLGPWLRTIQLDVDSGTAYVSSRGALYRVNYAAGLAGR
jgi:DNA-binding beta-propeller fold protein YncE